MTFQAVAVVVEVEVAVGVGMIIAQVRDRGRSTLKLCDTTLLLMAVRPTQIKSMETGSLRELSVIATYHSAQRNKYI